MTALQSGSLKKTHLGTSMPSGGGHIIRVSHDDQEAEQAEPVRLAPGTVPTAERAELVASALFDRSGAWTLALRHGETPVGNPLPYPIPGASPLEWLADTWKLIAGALGLVYVVAFLTLFYGAHRSTVAFRILTDAVWAKALTWPFFFLRQSPAVQLWVLEPWFQKVRMKLTDHSVHHPFQFVDPPATGSDRQELAATDLLQRLSTKDRIWLQGRTGMGKSMVFTAWERSYFHAKEPPTLAGAAGKFGFVLVTLPVRLYAKMDPPEKNNPESWVVEAVRLRFEQFGLVIKDRGMWETMLRSGRFALALDGTNEADRSDSIIAFARQFPQVRIIATSQSGSPTGARGDIAAAWDTWALPRSIAELRERLLCLWLGDTDGSILARRLIDEGLTDVITSGYDLRLVADLAQNDPSGTVLPEGRVGLYRMVLDGATRADGEAADFGPLRQLALRMLIDGRREFTDEEARKLGAGTIDMLAQEGVRIVRRSVGQAWELRHDQMRAFLAASCLFEDSPTLPRMIAQIEEMNAFSLRRDDQTALWDFLAALQPDEQSILGLWTYAQADPLDRHVLQGALQGEADLRGLELVRPAMQSPSLPATEAVKTIATTPPKAGIAADATRGPRNK